MTYTSEKWQSSDQGLSLASLEREVDLDLASEPFDGDAAVEGRASPPAGVQHAQVMKLIESGQRDPNRITDALFHPRHPELQGRPLVKGQEALMREWRQLRAGVVQPALQQAMSSVPSAAVPLASWAGKRALLIGDSHTEGPFGAVLQRLLRGAGAEVVRLFQSGTSVSFWAPRLRTLLQQHRPDVVIIALGANMRAAKYPRGITQQVANFVVLLRKTTPAARLIWIGPPREQGDNDADHAVFNRVLRDGLDAATRFVDSAPHTPSYAGPRRIKHFNGPDGERWARGVFAVLSGGASGGAAR